MIETARAVPVIINATMNECTREQYEAGVTLEVREDIIRPLLQFEAPPNHIELVERAHKIAYEIEKVHIDACEDNFTDPATELCTAMIGGPEYLMGPLERVLIEKGIAFCYDFSLWRWTDSGVVKERIGFVE